MKKVSKTLVERFLSKTPKVIKRIQLMLGVFSGGGASIVASCNYLDSFVVPNWVNEYTMYSSIGSIILMGFLQLFTENNTQDV